MMESWSIQLTFGLVLLGLGFVSGGIVTQNLVNESVTCPSRHSLCWLLRLGSKQVIDQEKQAEPP